MSEFEFLENYERIPGEREEWYRCLHCGSKVYIGDENKTDFYRHERRCEDR